MFAVLQHGDSAELREQQAADLDFAPVVQSCGTLLLCAAPLTSLESLVTCAGLDPEPGP